jgi:hypothetical protein
MTIRFEQCDDATRSLLKGRDSVNRSRTDGGVGWRSRTSTALAALAVAGAAAPAATLDAPPPVAASDPEPAQPSPRSLDPSIVAAASERGAATLAGPVKAVASFEGTPGVGLRVTLRGDRSTGPNLKYRWLQTLGPAVILDEPAGAVASFQVPEAATSLGFLLMVGGDTGLDVAAVQIEVEGASPAADAGLMADAGDDLIGVVGRQVTLNGVRSHPRGTLAYRWIQVAGPAVGLKLEDRYIYTFVPPQPGLYRFALVVAADGAISQPDMVDVLVAAPPGTPAGGAPAPAPVRTTGELIPAALAELPGGADRAAELGTVFSNVVARMPLFESYAVLHQDLTRKLEEIVPAGAAERDRWNERLFSPLMARIVERMRVEGLDLASPGGLTAPLSEPHRHELAQLFQAIAEAFQAAPARQP